MQVEEAIDVSAFPCAEFLSAEELVALRKTTEETPQPVIGEKLYTRSDAGVEEESLKCALESYKETLDKKRAARICDLMEAKWNPELNIVIVPKLKGKFTQHMGHSVNGEHILAPEEAVFLLENNCIEIRNGETPMSTEEAFNMILKGNLGLEKYQVYSHLSKLGYVVVLHQSTNIVAEYEKEINKHPVQMKRSLKEPSEGEPEKKRLTFTGALSEGSETKTASDASGENSATAPESEITMEETKIPEGSEHDIADKSVDGTDNFPRDSEAQNGNGAFTDKLDADIQSDIDKINQTSVNDSEIEGRRENKDGETSKEINSSVEEKENVVEVRDNSEPIPVQSQNFNELTENTKLQNALPLRDNGNKDFLDSNSQSSRFVDIMDVDGDEETSCTTSEVSRDNFNAFDSNANLTSRDSCISVNNEDNTREDSNQDSNSDVLSMSCSGDEEEDEVLTIDAGSADNLGGKDDDEVTLLEVTKKETKPLAVIDLLSDDDDETEAVDVVDDDITVIEEYPSPSTGRPTSSRDIKPQKLNGCKKEEKDAVVSSSKTIPPLTVQVPELFKKRVVCIARPPLYLLPNHVKPSKEAYVLNLKTKNPDLPSLNNRVWNSYRDMQDYQRQRRHGRHQNRGQYAWNNPNARNRDRPHRPGFDRMNSPDVNSSSRGLPGPPQVDFNRNLFPTNPYQNYPTFPNPSTVVSEVTVKEDTSDNLVNNCNQSPHSNNIRPPDMPNNPLINPMMPMENFMAGIQRNAFNMGNHTHLMAELQRTCFQVAQNVLSSMLSRNPPMIIPGPNMNMFPPGINPPSPFNPSMSNGYNNSFNLPSSNEYFSQPQQNFGEQQRRFHRGRPFPCRYRNVGNKRSWSEVKSAVCNSSSDSDIEEMPISPSEILWDSKDVCPLVKPGVHYPVASVLKFLQVTQKAKVTYKYGYTSKSLSKVSNLEISFDVYSPGFKYKKTCPQVPKYRIVVVRPTDPFPKYSDIALLQRAWNDSATLLIAVNDNGDISFQSFNSISLPLLTPHEE